MVYFFERIKFYLVIKIKYLILYVTLNSGLYVEKILVTFLLKFCKSILFLFFVIGCFINVFRVVL